LTPKSSLETSLNATINYFPFEQVGAWSKTDFTELVKATVIINEDDIRRHQPTKLQQSENGTRHAKGFSKLVTEHMRKLVRNL